MFARLLPVIEWIGRMVRLGRGLAAEERHGSDSLPRDFGRYVLRQRLGGGGMGTVYRAYDRNLEIEVALKIPHAHLMQEDGALERFYGEARAAARLRHPYLCAVLDVGQI